MGIKRVLVGLTAVVLVTSAVVACGFRGTGPWGDMALVDRTGGERTPPSGAPTWWNGSVRSCP